jgi:hypothetical protein
VTSHLDADVLADYREGLLSRRRSARISTHLAGCARCSSLEAGLAEVSALLASAPTPTMPAHLVARLENALAAEAAATAEGKTAGTGHRGAGTANDAAPGSTGAPGRRVPPGPVRRRPDRPARRPQWRTGLLGAAAVIAVILVVGVYGLVKLAGQGGPGGSSASGSSGAASQPSGAPAFASRGAAGSPAGPDNALLPAGKLHLIASGTDYQPGTLAGQVASVLARKLNQEGAAEPGHLTPASATPGTEDRLRACVTQITGGTPPRFVDRASYQGRPATIIVQAAVSGRPQQVWVVGPACSAGHTDLIAHTELPSQG